ncbi:hypothetical protein CEXT_413021 [Caerostris extrusa]|uniref:Uncharacterized protein n=1 Tax=Caerostris extrusa TaxID=172846 RepID=A0AAV4N5U6_CAEEX|nr:hypothetical protein CEXT_413021 [Caerostris extrusa]
MNCRIRHEKALVTVKTGRTHAVSRAIGSPDIGNWFHGGAINSNHHLGGRGFLRIPTFLTPVDEMEHLVIPLSGIGLRAIWFGGSIFD